MVPVGWTDDLSIPVDPDRTIDELVDFILEHGARFEVLTTRFGLSFEDARLAVDRVAAGQLRAAMGPSVNPPDPVKDPVAHASYRRALGKPAPSRKRAVSATWGRLIRTVREQPVENAVKFARSFRFKLFAKPQEREAADLWCHALEASQNGTRPATSSAAVIRLLELAQACADTPHDERMLRNVLLQVGTAISSLAEARISQRGPEGHASEGTPVWFDAIRLGEAAGELSRMFSQRGDPRNEGNALHLRGRIITSLLGHCRHRVGGVMLESISYYRRMGEDDEAASMCEAIIADFGGLADSEDLDAEDKLALRHLAEAIEIYMDLRDDVSVDIRELRERCSRLLEPPSGEPLDGARRA